MKPYLQCRVLEDLRLHGPDDHLGIAQKSTGSLMGINAEVSFEFLLRRSKGLHHVKLVGRKALFNQAADDGTGHVAATNKRHSFAHRFSC